MKHSGIVRALATMATVVVIVAACSSGATTQPPSAAAPSAAAAPSSAAASPSSAAASPSTAAKTYTIGYSNGGGVGNGFREEQLCTARAEALSSGQVSKITVTSRNTDAAGQLQDIRDLIAKGVNAIVFNPNDPAALNPALLEAQAAGIKTVSVDAYVTDPKTYNLYNNQVKYAYLGATWLFKQLGGKGTVYYMRGIAGNPADNDRDVGFKQALAQNPGIKVVPAGGVATAWDPGTATKLANEFIASGQYDTIQGIWTSGIDSEVVDAIKAAGKTFVPIVGTDRGSFIKQLLDPVGFPGLKGVAVTNTAAVGGAGVNLALKLLNGQPVTPTAGAKPNTVLLDPIAVDNQTDAGKAQLKGWLAVTLPDPTWPLGITIDGWTTYTAAQAVPPAGCKGPGE
jgi:ribose transport system substrate-binding protein